jgi:TonB-linked SusC/RagA family outer membrane protein
MKKKKMFFLLLTCFFAINSLRVLAQDPPLKAELTVTGTVRDENDKPLPGITVQVKGGGASTITDADGKYRIVVPRPNSVLIFSYIGYQTKELGVNNHMLVNTSLELATKSLTDVVVIGYGTQAKRDVTGSIATMDARKLEERPIERIDQALVGQLPGVTVKQTTGIPGKAFSIQVRGSGSISAGNEPLYVIDGFPLANNSTNTGNGSYTGGNPLDNLNPNDIESIEVLKDAAAAAIYGSRASNGVIIITTKHGQSGKTKISVNSYEGYNQASKVLKMLDDKGWIDRATEMINAAYVLKYPGASASDDSLTRIGRVGAFNVAYFTDPRWAIPGHPGLEYFNGQTAIERTGMMQNEEVSASGGTDAVHYFISGNYSNQEGFIIGVNYKEYSARANIAINAAKGLRLGVNVAPSYSITEDPGVEGKDNIFHQSLSMSVVQPDSVGLFPNIGKNAQYPWSNSLNSPVGKLTYNIGETKRFRTLGTVYGEWDIFRGLTLRSSVNLDNTDNNAATYVPYITTGTQTSRTFNAQTNPNLTSATSGTYNSFRRQTFVNENTLNYTKTFNDVHSLHILLGESFNEDRLDQVTLSSNGGFTSSVIQTLSAAAGVTGNTQSSKSTLFSYFARAQYAYKDKYLLSASLRRDGSSRFGANNQYGLFPSASLGWRMIDEDFMKNVRVLSDLKLRVSYGENGNNNIGNYGSIATLGSFGYVLGTPTAVIGQAPNALANPSLQWEKSHAYDAGLDFGFLQNRIMGSFDYYNKLSTNLLLNVPVPEVTGQGSYLSNVGSVRNIGEELLVTTRNLTGKFEWYTTINISHNTNKIVALGPGQKQIIIPNGLDVSDEIERVGQPLNSIFVVRQIGILTQDDINKHVPLYGTGETVGDPKYQALNGDTSITVPNDEQIVGHPNPDYTWGITNTFHYKGFDLSVLIQGQHGGSIYSELGRAINRTGQGFTDNAPAFYADRWRSPSDPGNGGISKAYSTFGFVANTNWLYSSDYVRVRSITIGYDLKTFIKTSAIQGARIYLSAENFFGTDKYYGGLNPEAANTTISSNSNYPEAGDYGGLPLAKSLTLGVNFTF